MASHSAILTTVADIKVSNPENLMARHFSEDYFIGLDPKLQTRLVKIIKSGTDNPSSMLGMYAMNPDDYDVFQPYFDKVIRDYHKIPGQVHHITNWDISTMKGKLPENGILDLSKLGLDDVSMRVRVGRNLTTYPLPGAMTREDRVNLERQMVKGFSELMADPAYGGRYYSLTPGSPEHISDGAYQSLVNNRLMFKDMSKDPYLLSAGISADWPYGRGCYISEDKGFIVWIGEEDHLRIMCMKRGIFLNDVFDRLKLACDVISKHTAKFAHSETYGFVTSCPTNLGTGMRASVHVKIPKLTADGTEAKAKAICKPLGLSVRGVGGEHTPIGADGTVDISPSARLQIQEAEIIVALYEGIKNLLEEEKKA